MLHKPKRKNDSEMVPLREISLRFDLHKKKHRQHKERGIQSREKKEKKKRVLKLRTTALTTTPAFSMEALSAVTRGATRFFINLFREYDAMDA